MERMRRAWLWQTIWIANNVRNWIGDVGLRRLGDVDGAINTATLQLDVLLAKPIFDVSVQQKGVVMYSSVRYPLVYHKGWLSPTGKTSRYIENDVATGRVAIPKSD